MESPFLEDEQKELLSKLVEASRNVSKRTMFLAVTRWELGGDVTTKVYHNGLPDGKIDIFKGDLELLADAGLVSPLSEAPGRALQFYVSPSGSNYYEELKATQGTPLETVESEIHRYLDADHFQQRYPEVYKKWCATETQLWQSESEDQLTTICHLCREAMQAFVTALISQHKPTKVDSDPAHTVSRLKAVLEVHRPKLGRTGKPFLEAIIAYWRTVSDLIQRQEHGASKEGEPLNWEDGRRVVFQTIIVMFEIDRALSGL